MQRFRGGLVFEAHRLCVSLNARLEHNKEEEDGPLLEAAEEGIVEVPGLVRGRQHHHQFPLPARLHKSRVDFVGKLLDFEVFSLQ